MVGIGKQGTLLAALLGLCEIAAFNAAYAEPPMQKVAAALAHGSNGASKGPERGMPRLDLRPPSESPANEPEVAAPTGGHRLFATESLFRSNARTATPAASGHIMSPMETMAHNFRQEGLPVARLFQNSTSLVHVGLNPKGKPGLWVVHKIH
jgi:hypothetical protein